MRSAGRLQEKRMKSPIKALGDGARGLLPWLLPIASWSSGNWRRSSVGCQPASCRNHSPSWKPAGHWRCPASYGPTSGSAPAGRLPVSPSAAGSVSSSVCWPDLSEKWKLLSTPACRWFATSRCWRWFRWSSCGSVSTW